MNNIINNLRQTPKKFIVAALVLASAIIIPTAAFAWGPDRPTFTIANPADHVTFNSITDNPNIGGDERDFVNIRENGTTNAWSDNVQVQPGKEYIVRMYVHNNAAANLGLVAHDVTAMFNLPTTTAKSIEVNGFLSSSNATPSEIWDQAKFTSDQNFNLAYKSGTLKYFNNANSNGFTIPETVFTSAGAKLGYDKMDGNIPGCFQYAGYLTFIVTPQFADKKSDFTVKKEVRPAGNNQFTQELNAKAGDKLNYRLTFTNTGETELRDVKLTDALPTGITAVPGSVKIMNANNPAGAVVSDGDKLFTTGINIGSYSAGSNALVIFDATIAAEKDLAVCGQNSLVNSVTATVGDKSKSDKSTVKVERKCKTVETVKACNLDTNKIETNVDKSKIDDKHYTLDLAKCATTPSELPKTGISSDILSFIGLGSLVATAGAYITSRRAL